MEVTIIVPVYNTDRSYLIPCLQSVKAQTIPCHIIIVDDGSSSKETREILREFVSSTDSFHTIQLYRHWRRKGVAHARNTGLDHTKTPLVTFCDSDDILSPSKIEQQLNACKSAGFLPEKLEFNSVVITGTALDYRNDANYSIGIRSTDEASINAVDFYAANAFSDLNHSYLKLLRCNASFCGSNTMFPTKLLRYVGGFNPRLNGADEWDALLNCAKIGQVTAIPQVLCTYVRHRGSYSTTKIKRLRQTCELILYNHRKNLNDEERVYLQSVEVAQWAMMLERLIFLPNTPYPIVQYAG